MQRIISLFNEKNHYLEKFYALNETELLNFSHGNFENLEHFYQTRERILEILKYVDFEIDKANKALGDFSLVPEEQSREFRREAREALAIKDEYVSRIIAQDIEVLTCIETAKNSIIRELQDVRKHRRAIGGYKSKTFDLVLDEEA